MNDKANTANLVEKDRIRNQIQDQVDEFLKQGGRIEVLDNERGNSTASIGAVWQSLRDELATSVSPEA